MIQCICYQFDWTIFWTMISAIATIGILMIAYFQFKKIRAQNSSQILFHLEDEWNGKPMRLKRKNLANELHKALINPEIRRSHLTLLNQIEDILDFFEKVSYLTNKGELDFELVYQIYSHDLIYYWTIIEKLEFISYVRNNRPNGKNFYCHCETLFKKIIKERDKEMIEDNNLLKFCAEEEGNLVIEK